MCGIKIWKKIVLSLAAVLVLAAAGLAVWQWDTVKPYFLSKVLDRASLSDKLDKLHQENQKQLEQQGVAVPGLSKQQMDDLLEGTITAEEAAQALSLDAYQSDQTVDDLVNRCVAELYRYESALYARLGEIRQSALAEWRSYPKSERTRALKQSIKSAVISECYALETSSDDQVSAILDQYQAQVESRGGDGARIRSLWSVYCSEKASVKAYYFNLLSEKESKNQ